MYCKYCSFKVDGDAKFCPNCGKALDNNLNSSIDNKIYYILGCVPILFWLPLISPNRTEFGKQVANQGLLLLILSFLGNMFFKILKGFFKLTIFTYPISWLVTIVSFVYGIFILVYIILSMVNASKYKLTKIPVIGEINLIK